jgi:hypothetical protein
MVSEKRDDAGPRALLAASSPLHSLSPIAPKDPDDGFPVSM